MKKFKIFMAALGILFVVSSCALTEDGIVPQDQILNSGGTITTDPEPVEPPFPDPLG